MDLAKAGLSVLPSIASGGSALGGASGTATGAFGDVLKNMVQATMDKQNEAQALSAAAASGQDVPLHQLVQSLSQAELTLQVNQTRSKDQQTDERGDGKACLDSHWFQDTDPDL